MRQNPFLAVAGGVAFALAVIVLPLTVAAESVEEAEVGFEPGYPPGGGGGYDIYTATIRVNPLALKDGDGDGSVRDERCDTNFEGGLRVANELFDTIAAAAAICDANPSPAQEGCYVPIAVFAVIALPTLITENQCGYQDALIDGAEIEAAYENTRLFAALQLEDTLQRRSLKVLVSHHLPRAFGGRLEEVRDLVETRIAQATLAGFNANHLDKANSNFTEGNTEFAVGAYKQAYVRYAAAYRALLTSRDP